MRETFQPAVYVLASKRHGTLYVGVTSDLAKRVHEHRHGLIPGFASRYGCTRLVHFELFGTMELAIAREKRMKEWRRAWKIELIEELNPEWVDLGPGLGLGAMSKGDRHHGSRLSPG